MFNLKFKKMKKQLLTVALILTSVFALNPSIAEAKSTMDSNLKLVWMTQMLLH